MSRTKSMGETTQRAIRLPVMLLERLERHAERMRRRTPGLSISVADAVRTLLTAALDREEAAEAEPPGAARERGARPASPKVRRPAAEPERAAKAAKRAEKPEGGARGRER